MSNDFIIWGLVEQDECGVTHGSIRSALLNQNPRRCLVRPIMLTSNNGKVESWVSSKGDSVVAAQSAEATPSGTSDKIEGSCTDFVLCGWAEVGDAGIPLTGAKTSLLKRNKDVRSAVTLTSNNARCTHFVGTHEWPAQHGSAKRAGERSCAGRHRPL